MKKDYDGTALSSRLRSLMHENETTQQKLAELLNISRQSVAQYLDCSAQPSIDKLYKLAEYFDCSTDYLLGASPYRNFQEWSEMQESKDDVEDGENVSHFGMGIYRDFKGFVDFMNSTNSYHGYEFFTKSLISSFPFDHIRGIIFAYKEAVESMASENLSHISDKGKLIERFLKNIREADSSGTFIKTLLEIM